MKSFASRLRLQPSIVAVLLLSFSSSLPLVLVGSTLQAWYTVAGVNLLTIGMLTLVGQPYVYKFLWAPLVDRFAPFKFDRRRSWILLTQFGLVLGLIAMSCLDPAQTPWWLAWVAMLVACLSATQDIAIDAYRVDVLAPASRGLGAAVSTFGGRLAILVGGALSLIFADHWGWRTTYLIMAGVMLLEMGVTWWSPKVPPVLHTPSSLKAAVVEPIREMLAREHALVILLFVVLYKLCDALALALNTTFLIRGVGFGLTEVGLIYKSVSLIALLLGSFVGGYCMSALGLYQSLLRFGLLQAFSNLTYCWLALVGKNYAVMVISVFTEYFCSGLSTVAFIVFLMSLCNKRYSAAQYALLSALMAIARVFAGPEVAVMVDHLGWASFYFVTFLLGFPPIVLLLWLRKRIEFRWEPASVLT